VVVRCDGRSVAGVPGVEQLRVGVRKPSNYYSTIWNDNVRAITRYYTIQTPPRPIHPVRPYELNRGRRARSLRFARLRLLPNRTRVCMFSNGTVGRTVNPLVVSSPAGATEITAVGLIKTVRTRIENRP